MTAKYKGKHIKFLIPKHSYSISFTKPKGYHAYNCHIIYDNTKCEEIDEWVNYSSEISIRNNWDFDGNVLDNDD